MAKEKSDQKTVHTSREAWLKAATDALRPFFEECNYALPEKIRYGMAFTSQGRKGKTTGQCIFPEASADGHHEILIRFDRDDAAEVLDVLVHQLVHAVASIHHDRKFRDAALVIGLDVTGGLTDSLPGKRLKQERLNALVVELGPLPHGRVDFAMLGTGRAVADRPKSQSKRMYSVKCLAPEPSGGVCGYLANITTIWISKGTPPCPLHHTPLTLTDPKAPPELVEKVNALKRAAMPE